jgi:hypothetical protein
MSAQVERFLNLCQTWDGNQISPELSQETRWFLDAARSDQRWLIEAAQALPTLPPEAAAWLCLTFGNAVENGFGIEVTGPAVLERFLATVDLLPDGDDPTTEQERQLTMFTYLCQSVVAHLARLPHDRQRLATAQLLERLEDLSEYTYAARWVESALRRASGPLIVLHPPTRTGLLLQVHNVAWAFHLFSLLQTAVGTQLPGGREPDPRVSARARGQIEENVDDQAWWHYGHPHHLEPTLGSSIWGEQTVASLPRVDDHMVMLLWPPLLGTRSWGAGFFDPHLDAMPPDVVVDRQLTPDEVDAWLTRLAAAEPSARIEQS